MLLWITPAYRQPELPIFHCRDCHSRADLATCVTCGQKVCPSCRVGTGSLDDGYECLSHWRSTMPSKTRSRFEETLKPARRSLHEWLPWALMGATLASAAAAILHLVLQ